MESNDSPREDLTFGFPINLGTVLTHLKQDIRDDWFYDCLQYMDLFSDQAGSEKSLLGILREGNGRYEAQGRVLRDIPKKGLGIDSGALLVFSETKKPTVAELIDRYILEVPPQKKPDEIQKQQLFRRKDLLGEGILMTLTPNRIL